MFVHDAYNGSVRPVWPMECPGPVRDCVYSDAWPVKRQYTYHPRCRASPLFGC